MSDKKSSKCNLDLSKAKEKIWIVKVPKYIAEAWEKTPGNVTAAKMRLIGIPGQKPKATLHLTDAALNKSAKQIPRDHVLDYKKFVTDQSVAVFSENNASNSTSKQNQLAIEGKVVQKIDCRPSDLCHSAYMKLKREAILDATVPKQQVIKLDKAVQNFKPVSDLQNKVENPQSKQTEVKKCRADKEIVLEILFGAFEKHQFYNIKDLVKITKQPITYLKEILKDVCNYNVRNPHKNMWELKPEYRHYGK